MSRPGDRPRAPEGHHHLPPTRAQQRVQPAVAVVHDGRVVTVAVPPALALDAVQEGVDHHIGDGDAQSRKPVMANVFMGVHITATILGERWHK